MGKETDLKLILFGLTFTFTFFFILSLFKRRDLLDNGLSAESFYSY